MIFPPESRGLTASVEALLARFAIRLRATASRHGLDEVDVSDVEQEVRIRLWRAGERETGKPLATSYIAKTVLSAVRDVLRRRRAHGGVLRADVVNIQDVPLAVPATAESALVGDELARLVFASVRDLPDNRRVVVQLHLDGYDRKQMVAITGWTEGKVRNLLSRGLADLREALRVHGVESGGVR